MSSNGETTERRAEILDGNAIAAGIKAEVKEKVARLRESYGVQPCLVAVRVGDDAASDVYVRNKIRVSQELGLKSEHLALGAETSVEELLEIVSQLNERADVDGILVQLPLPSAINERKALEQIDPAKDVDGFHPVNVGRLVLNQPAFMPCTPAGIIELLKRSKVSMSGARACVVGRSHIVGRPVAQLLLQENATVTVCHSRTVDLASITSQADILIVAIGRAALIRGQHIKPGAIVVDVGMNKITDEAKARELFGDEAEKRINSIRARGYTLVGDVHPRDALRAAGKFTPVPGGIGPLTVAMLMHNTLQAALMRRGIKEVSEQ